MMDEPESGLRIVWDERKARSNLRKHKVSFEEAESVFADPLSITKPDPDHSTTQNRFLTLGLSFKHRQYSSVIRLSATQDALYLSVLFPFRAGHPPLRIPWNEISFAQTTLLWNRYVVLTLGDEEQIPMRISQRMARNLGITDRFLADNAYIGR